MTDSKPTFFTTPELFREWLEGHSQVETELLVGFWKANSKRQSMTWSQSVDEAICYGWIDGVRRRIDEDSYSIRFTPRRPGSNWSAVNISKIESLLAEGRVTEAGEKAYQSRSESKSRVYSYEQDQPAELTSSEVSQFRKQPTAWRYFSNCPPGYRRKMVHWITSAKKLDTRARRLAKLVSACESQKRIG
ncbi:MAG: YdeI family protein [Planctomycetaceae bacterium]